MFNPETDRIFEVEGGRLKARAVPGAIVRTKWAEGPQSPEAERAAARALRPFVREVELPLLTWDKPETQSWIAALVDVGFTVHRRKLLVTRDLDKTPAPGPEFEWRSLSSMPEAEFVAVMAAASEGDPFEEEGERDHDKEWSDLLLHVGDDLDRDLWRVALVDGEVAGVVLPRVWPEDNPPGTLCYVGLLPAFRGRGLGWRLHAWGLTLLRAAGAARYVGSTDERNAAMARTFEKNGCPVEGIQVFLRP